MRVTYRQSEVGQNRFIHNSNVQKSQTFGIANSGKLKTLFTYGLPCMYTGVEMIDPRKVQRMLKTNAFEAPAAKVVEILEPFEKSITDVEGEVYKIVKQTSEIYPDMSLQQILKAISPQYQNELKSQQLPILQKILDSVSVLPDDNKYKFLQLINETEDKINEKPIFIPFSSFEFKYNLDKIRGDIIQNCSKKAKGAIDKMVLEASRLTDETDPKTLETQQQIMRFLKIILKSSVLKNNEKLKNLIEQSRKRLNNEKFLVPFSRKTFIYDLNKLLEPLSDSELKQKLQSLAISLPTSRNSVPAYIIKFSREPSWKIGYRLLWPNLASVEHIFPHSNGGADEMYNFGGAGARVNAERGNIDFTEQLCRVPETAENLQKYVNALIKLVKRGVFNKISQKTTYIDDFCNTIYNQSLGKLRLNIDELKEHRQKGDMLLKILAALNLH